MQVKTFLRLLISFFVHFIGQLKNCISPENAIWTDKLSCNFLILGGSFMGVIAYLNVTYGSSQIGVDEPLHETKIAEIANPLFYYIVITF